VSKDEHGLSLVLGLVDELGQVCFGVNERGAPHVVMMVHH
jgi:hypothetical protein